MFALLFSDFLYSLYYEPGRLSIGLYINVDLNESNKGVFRENNMNVVERSN